MDYEFLRDITGVVKVRMSMGHEVVGHWFNEEVKENLALLDEVEQAAHALKGSERSWQRAGHEYTLWMDGEACRYVALRIFCRWWRLTVISCSRSK